MDKQYETAILKRETAAGSAFIRGMDIIEGDLVQIKGPGHDSGRVGRVIGVNYFKRDDDLRVTVMFSDKEAKCFSGDRLGLVRKASE